MTTLLVDRTDAYVGELRQQIATLEAEHDLFRRNVRAEVLRQHFHGSWCLPGSQDVLRDLGLPPIAMAFDGNAQLWIRIMNVDGSADYEDAKARVTQAFEVTCSDPGIEFEVQSVDPALYQREVEDA